jgi:peptidoglycan/LPS O-acetylase OafA/YrhL
VLERGVELGASEFLFDKWHLGPLRVLNFAAVAALLIVAQSALKPLAIRPLVMLGQSSLQVFCVHLLFCFAGLTLMGNASMLDGWRQSALLIATFSAMLLTAKLFAKSEAKQERQPKGKISSELRLQTDPTSQIEPIRSRVPPINDAMPGSATSNVE